MYKKILKSIAAYLTSAAMIAPTVANLTPPNISAENVFFNYTFESLENCGWVAWESAPANQYASLRDNAYRVEIHESEGISRKTWDLMLYHNNLNFKKGHTYTVSFKVKSDRTDVRIRSFIHDGDFNKSFLVLNQYELVEPSTEMSIGSGAYLSTEYQTFKGTFTATEDITNAQWYFDYAYDSKHGALTEDGDVIWFDDMSIVCETCPDGDSEPGCGIKHDHYKIIDSNDDTTETLWEPLQTEPAKQTFAIEDGAFHINIIDSSGAYHEKWDLMLRHQNLNFKKNHVYKVKFRAKSSGNDQEISSRICGADGMYDYFVLDGENGVMTMGPHKHDGSDNTADGGKWGPTAKLTTEYQTFEGIFIPTGDITNATWDFQYADGTNFPGHAADGNEIWFDDISITCESCTSEEHDPMCGYNPDVDKPPVKYGLPIVDTRFDYNSVPWRLEQVRPARQEFRIDEGEFIIYILKSTGFNGIISDLQFKHNKLSFKAGHTYKVSFDAKASRDGMVLSSQIWNTSGDKWYFVLNDDIMQMGPDMGGQWGAPTKLTTEYKTFEGVFTPTEDIEDAEWVFEYAMDYMGYGGNAQDGDELYFDNMSIICESCPEDSTDSPCGYTGDPSYGYTSRDYAAKTNPDLISDGEIVNYISVNQLGYFPNYAKVATLGDNSDDMLYNASTIELTQSYYEFELVDAKSGKVVYENLSGKVFKDTDSGDNVCKLDFSDYTGTGEYYLRIKDENWRSFTFRIADDIYSQNSHNLLTDALNYFYQSRSGMSIEEKYITSGDASKLAHKAVHQNDTAYVQKIWYDEYITDEEASETYASSKIEANGGWYDAGDYTKSLINGGMTVWTLQNMYERAILNGGYEGKFDDGSGTVVVPETGNKIPDILEEAAYELDWMAKMKVTKDDPTWGEYEGLYYHKLQDYKYTELTKTPWDYISYMPDSRIIKPPTFAATLNYAAAAAQAARLWAPYDTKKAETYLESAVEAYNAYMTHWYDYDHTMTGHPDYCIDCSKEEINETSFYAPEYQARVGAAYHDDDVLDDAYWAACEIFVSASEMNETSLASYYKKELSKSEYAYDVMTRLEPEASYDGEFTSFKWEETASAGSLSLALHPELLSEDEVKQINNSILEAADDYLNCEDEQGYGIPYKYDGPGYYDPTTNLDVYDYSTGYRYGSNGMSTTNAIVMAYAYDITYDRKYINGVVQAMDYLLGNNPLSFSYITGYGSYSAKNPHHTYWINELDSNYPLAPDGILVGGPSTEISDYAMKLRGFVFGNADNVSQRCYIDSIEAWSVNEASLQWNASLAWVVSFLQDEAGSTSIQEGTLGDVNGDEKVLLNDAVLILQHLGNPDEYPLTEQAKLNADVDNPGSGLTNKDALRIQQYLLGIAGLDE